jgi:hypothetical protein
VIRSFVPTTAVSSLRVPTDSRRPVLFTEPPKLNLPQTTNTPSNVFEDRHESLTRRQHSFFTYLRHGSQENRKGAEGHGAVSRRRCPSIGRHSLPLTVSSTLRGTNLRCREPRACTYSTRKTRTSTADADDVARDPPSSCSAGPLPNPNDKDQVDMVCCLPHLQRPCFHTRVSWR